MIAIFCCSKYRTKRVLSRYIAVANSYNNNNEQ